jgi:hypothetical protein
MDLLYHSGGVFNFHSQILKNFGFVLPLSKGELEGVLESEDAEPPLTPP